MEQYSLTIEGTSSYVSLGAEQHSSIETESQREMFEISRITGDFLDLYPSILPNKQYRVVAGRLYVIDPGSPPSSHQ